MGSSLIHSCFRSGGREGVEVATAQTQKQTKLSPPRMAAPTSTTTVYETPYGFAALTWSRSSLLGISLRVDLRVPLPSSTDLPHHHQQLLSSPSSSTADHLSYPLTSLRFRLRPFLPWRRRGSRRFRFRHPPRTVDFAWDLSHATFPPGGSPEPHSRYSFSASLDGDLHLAAGDNVKRDSNPFHLASRTEHVVIPKSSSSSSASYSSTVMIGNGLERVVSLDLPAGAGEKDARMTVSIDGRKVLHVKRLRWKFRGSERVELEPTGGGALVAWDVHGWVFPGRTEGLPTGVEEAPAGANSELGWAVVVVRFDGTMEGSGGRGGKGVWGLHGVVGCENCGEERRNEGWRKRRKSLLKTRSSSSSVSSASSACSSSVMEWASAEENDLRESEGFTLAFYLWRG